MPEWTGCPFHEGRTIPDPRGRRPLKGRELAERNVRLESNPMSAWTHLGEEQYCYLTTTGRVTGRPHRIEIWFAIDGTIIYLLSGGRERSDWVKNLRREPSVRIEIGNSVFGGQARMVGDESEDQRARRLVHDKYARGYSGDLTGWRGSALPIAIDLLGDVAGTEARP
jgi:deazaflavin-dependent oxidoreductase (nitroreductase family)